MTRNGSMLSLTSLRRQRISVVLGVSLLLAAAQAYGDAADNALSQARQLATALVGGDFMKVAELTHPKVVSRVGGPQAVASSLHNAMLAAQLELHSMDFSEPRQMVSVGNGYIATLPFESKATLRGEPVTLHSFYIGFSPNGRQWHFIDCQGVNHVTLKQLAPAYDHSLNLSGC